MDVLVAVLVEDRLTPIPTRGHVAGASRNDDTGDRYPASWPAWRRTSAAVGLGARDAAFTVTS